MRVNNYVNFHFWLQNNSDTMTCVFFRFVKCMDDRPKCLNHTRDVHVHSSPSEDSSASSNHWMNFKSCGDKRYKNSKLTQSSFTQRFQLIPTKVVLVTLLALLFWSFTLCSQLSHVLSFHSHIIDSHIKRMMWHLMKNLSRSYIAPALFTHGINPSNITRAWYWDCIFRHSVSGLRTCREPSGNLKAIFRKYNVNVL